MPCPELVCLHPAVCGLAFDLEELQKLPQQTLWDLVSRTRAPVEEPTGEPQRLSIIAESEDEDIESVANALREEGSEEEEEEEGDDDDGDGVMYAAFNIEHAISTRQISVRTPRRTRVKLEEVEAAASEESWPEFERGESSLPFLLKSLLTFPRHTFGTRRGGGVCATTSDAPCWDSIIPLDSVTAPPPLRKPIGRAEKVDAIRASSAEPSDEHSHRKELAEALREARKKRGNAQSRLCSARKRIKAGEWAPERLDKAERERVEAGAKQMEAQAALDAWDACH